MYLKWVPHDPFIPGHAGHLSLHKKSRHLSCHKKKSRAPLSFLGGIPPSCGLTLHNKINFSAVWFKIFRRGNFANLAWIWYVCKISGRFVNVKCVVLFLWHLPLLICLISIPFAVICFISISFTSIWFIYIPFAVIFSFISHLPLFFHFYPFCCYLFHFYPFSRYLFHFLSLLPLFAWVCFIARMAGVPVIVCCPRLPTNAVCHSISTALARLVCRYNDWLRLDWLGG